MLFNSYIFIFGFLPITLAIFFTLGRFRLLKVATAWLTLSSFLFYANWSVAYIPLLCISIGWNYFIGQSINGVKQGSRAAKNFLTLGIGVNLLLLGYYKYAGFFIQSIDQISGANLVVPEIILPLGISFYTFTQTAYLVDSYRGETKDYGFLTYVLFVTFFPHLIAGPILHHREVIPQFNRARNFLFSHQNMSLGIVMFCLGLAKKVLIADSVMPWVAPVFNNAGQVNFIEAWVGALSYTLQLYFDFSGYSDMAVGLGFMLNIALPINFNSPYKATSISDFWRRWHITLSNFLRDYLYIPLGGSRRGEVRRYTNLLITMLLGGFWHGAGWTYIIWGGLHGIYLCINHGWRKLKLPLPTFLAWLFTFLAVIVGWVFFRARTPQEAIDLLQAMAGLHGVVLPGEAGGKLSALGNLGIELQSWHRFTYLPVVAGHQGICLLVLFGLILGVVFLPNSQQIIIRFKPSWEWSLGIGLLTGLSLLSLNRVSEFLYFQF